MIVGQIQMKHTDGSMKTMNNCDKRWMQRNQVKANHVTYKWFFGRKKKKKKKKKSLWYENEIK